MTKSYVSLDYKFGNQDYGYLWWLPYRDNNVIAVTGYFKPMVFDRVEYIEKNIVEALIK